MAPFNGVPKRPMPARPFGWRDWVWGVGWTLLVAGSSYAFMSLMSLVPWLFPYVVGVTLVTVVGLFLGHFRAELRSINAKREQADK